MKQRKYKYLSNHNLLHQISLSKRNGRMTDELFRMLQLLVKRLSERPNFAGYSYVDEMREEAMLQLVQGWSNFDSSKSDNPFSYFTTIAMNAFRKVLNAEAKLAKIR